jgi:hypothetical protein
MMIPFVSIIFIVYQCIYLVYCQQQVLSPQPRLRNATLEDADDIATVVVAAFSPMRDWQYIYQFREKYPKEHYRCGRFEIIQALNSSSFRVEVIEAPAGSNLTVAAIAFWSQNATEDDAFSYHLSSKIKASCLCTRCLQHVR